MKPHLAALPKNEGARRLLWWLTTHTLGIEQASVVLAQAINSHVSVVDRLLSGELVPGADMGFKISKATGRLVVLADWYDPPNGSWFSRPWGFPKPAPSLAQFKRAAALPRPRCRKAA